MTNAVRDSNYITGGLGVLNTDGTTLIPVAVNEATGGFKVSTVDTISFTMTPMSKKDANLVNVLLWVGSDGLTYPWVVNSSGAVLVNY